MRILLKILVFLGVNFLVGHVHSAPAGVVFFDAVTTVNTPIYLTVLTKGLFAPEGGCLVDIYSQGHKIGRILSGGDGYGFLKLVPKTVGLQTFEARRNGHTDTASVLTIKKTDRVLLFEVDVFSRPFLSKTIGGETREALNELSKKFKLVYLSRFSGTSAAKRVISTLNLPPSVILEWQGQELLEELKGRGIVLAAMIASAKTITEAEDEVPKRFTFDEIEDDTFVEDWQEIIKKLD